MSTHKLNSRVFAIACMGLMLSTSAAFAQTQRRPVTTAADLSTSLEAITRASSPAVVEIVTTS